MRIKKYIDVASKPHINVEKSLCGKLDSLFTAISPDSDDAKIHMQAIDNTFDHSDVV
jgi:hypothetical protein